jgi:hypothetical protein
MLRQSDIDRLYELEQDELEIIIEQSHNAIRLLKAKPCTCCCHKLEWDWVDHIVACCDRVYEKF